MSSHPLPTVIAEYFRSKDSVDPAFAEAAFHPDAVVYDNGEDLEVRGVEAIVQWMSETSSKYEVTSEVRSAEEIEGRCHVDVAVSGNFPGSPYQFEYRFLIQHDQIRELVIEPIGPIQ